MLKHHDWTSNGSIHSDQPWWHPIFFPCQPNPGMNHWNGAGELSSRIPVARRRPLPQFHSKQHDTQKGKFKHGNREGMQLGEEMQGGPGLVPSARKCDQPEKPTASLNQSASTDNKRSKHVAWNPVVRFRIIPAAHDIADKSSVWWSAQEIGEFLWQEKTRRHVARETGCAHNHHAGPHHSGSRHQSACGRSGAGLEVEEMILFKHGSSSSSSSSGCASEDDESDEGVLLPLTKVNKNTRVVETWSPLTDEGSGCGSASRENLPSGQESVSQESGSPESVSPESASPGTREVFETPLTLSSPRFEPRHGAAPSKQGKGGGRCPSNQCLGGAREGGVVTSVATPSRSDAASPGPSATTPQSAEAQGSLPPERGSYAPPGCSTAGLEAPPDARSENPAMALRSTTAPPNPPTRPPAGEAVADAPFLFSTTPLVLPSSGVNALPPTNQAYVNPQEGSCASDSKAGSALIIDMPTFHHEGPGCMTAFDATALGWLPARAPSVGATAATSEVQPPATTLCEVLAEAVDLRDMNRRMDQVRSAHGFTIETQYSVNY